MYVCEDTACILQYVGSTTDVCARWGSTKKVCRDRNKTNTGLYKHFMDGCQAYNDTMAHLRWTLVDSMDTSPQLLDAAGHTGGPQCRCLECSKLKTLEDKCICRLTTFYWKHGLNSSDKIKAKSKVNYWKGKTLV